MLLSQLEYFRVVAKYEHISRAAEELHVAQPALSTMIGRLEKELGVPLFIRSGRNIELSDAGRRLLSHTDYLFSQISEMQHTLDEIKEILENEVTISVSNSMFLGGWLHSFVLGNPKIRLRQKMLSEQQMLDALRDETIDVAIGEFNQDEPGIVRKVLVEDEYVFSVAHSHPLAKKDRIVFEDIRNTDVIGLPSNATYKIADRLFASQGCEPKVIFEGNHRMMANLQKRGKGIVFATRQMLYAMYLAEQSRGTLPDDDGLKVHTVSDVDCRCTLCVCWKEDRELPVMAQKFIKTMDESYPRYFENTEFLKMIGLDGYQKGANV